MKEIIKRILDKVLSARFILAIIGGVAFLYMVISKSIEAAAMTTILYKIFDDYFKRQDRRSSATNNGSPKA